jgi:hypothetical protein
MSFRNLNQTSVYGSLSDCCLVVCCTLVDQCHSCALKEKLKLNKFIKKTFYLVNFEKGINFHEFLAKLKNGRHMLLLSQFLSRTYLGVFFNGKLDKSKVLTQTHEF